MWDVAVGDALHEQAQYDQLGRHRAHTERERIDLHEGEPDTFSFEQEDIFCPSAGAAAYRRSMLDAIKLQCGYFDRDHFMYYEDLDLGWRARLGGWSAKIVPRSIVHHKSHGGSDRHGRSSNDQMTMDVERSIVEVERRPMSANAPTDSSVESDLTPPAGLVVFRIEVGELRFALLTYEVSEAARLPALTDAEREVLQAIVAGGTNGEIAAMRGTAPRTVANQVARIFQKVNVRSRAELAVRWSIVSRSK